MSKRKTRNRLESLFADLEQEVVPLPHSEPASKQNDQNLQGEEAESGLSHQPDPSSACPTKHPGSPSLQNTSPDEPAILAVSVPLKVDASSLFEVLDEPSSRIWSDDERLLVEQVAGQLNFAFENARLFQQTQAALANMEALYQASAELNAVRNYKDILIILRKYTLFSQVDRLLTLSLFNRPWKGNDIPEWSVEVARWTNLKPETLSTRYPLRGSFVAGLLSPKEATTIADVLDDSRLDQETRHLVQDRLMARSAVFVPLIVGRQWIGFLSGFFGQKTGFPEEEIHRLMALSIQAAVVVQNLNNFELAEQRAREAHRRSEDLALINRIVWAVSASLDLKEALQIIATELVKALPIQRSGIALLNEERKTLTVMADYSAVPDTPSGVGVVIPLEGNLSTQQVLATRKPLVIPDAQTSPLTASIHGHLRQRGIQSLTILPLLVGSTVIGTIGLDILEKGRTLNPDEMRLVETIVIQSSTAIQNARLFAQSQQALAETGTLYQASSQLNAVQSYEEILEVLREHTLLGKDDSTITMDIFDQPWTSSQSPEWINVLARCSCVPINIANSKYPLQSFPLASQYLRADAPTLILDATSDPRLDEEARAILKNSFNAQSAIFLPLLVSGKWIGYLNGIYRSQVEFTEAEIRLLRGLLDQAAVAIQNIRLLEETRSRANQLQTAAEIARDTTSTLALDNLLKRTVNLICDRFRYDQVSVFLNDESGQNAVIRASTGDEGEEMKRQGFGLPVGSRSVIGYVVDSGNCLLVNDVTQDSVYRPHPLLPDTRSELGIALKIGEQVIGALDVQSRQLNAFTPDDVSVLQILADQIAVAVNNARSYELSQKAVEEMRELDRLKSQFLANMSHELRTPLNSIIGFSRVILKGIDGPITDLQQQDLNAIYNSGQHLLGLINDVLDLSKIEAGKMELAFEEHVNLSDLINSVMSTVVGLVKDKPVQLYKNIPSDIPTVRADPLKVRQVLLNLLSNAAKFTDQGSITVETIAQAGPNGHPEIKINVIDTGAGIAREDQEKLFQPFSQVDGSLTRKTDGSGLGLSICRHLVEMHGGRISLESEAGEGSRFFFTLPVSTIPTKMVDQLEDTAAPKIILAIDDERQTISLYERYLSRYGFKVIALTDPQQTLKRAQETLPYAIILDAMLPECGGWQVLKAIKTELSTKNIPVILCSILGNQEKGFCLGAMDYLLKPIPEENMVQAINRLNGSGNIHDILAIDEDLNNLRWIEKIFQGHPTCSLQVKNGYSKALQDIRLNPPHAILLGMRATFAIPPELDGFTLLEILRTDLVLREIPTVVYTGGDLDADQQKRLEELSQAMLQRGLVKEDELLNNLVKTLSCFENSAPP